VRGGAGDCSRGGGCVHERLGTGVLGASLGRSPRSSRSDHVRAQVGRTSARSGWTTAGPASPVALRRRPPRFGADASSFRSHRLGRRRCNERRGSRLRCRRGRRRRRFRRRGHRRRRRHRLGRARRRRGSGRGRRRRLWSGRRRGSRRRGRRPRRQERQRVDVGLPVGQAYPEVDVGDVVLGVARRTGLGDRLAFADDISPSHEQRAEMRQRSLVAARRGERDRRAVRRNLPCKRHLPRLGRTNDRSSIQCDVDAAVLSARVRVVADGVTAQHGAVSRPCPGERVGCRREQPHEPRERDDHRSRCPMR
jgi:hypothetical protein